MWDVSRFRIGARLAAGFGLMLLLIAGLVVSTVLSLQQIGRENSQLIERELVESGLRHHGLEFALALDFLECPGIDPSAARDLRGAIAA